MSIKIPVSADFDPSAIEAQLQQFREKLNALGQQISAANKVQFEPVSKTSLDDLRKMTAQFEALKRVSGDLNRRVNATGQKGAGFFDLDWAKMYPDQHSRARQMSKSFQYVTGLGFHTPPSPQQPNAPLPTRPGGGGGGGGGFAPAVGGVAQAGLRAMGPVGGVAAGALGTGMGAGVGAGLAGLVGGLVALGVGKFISAATEKIGAQENNAVSFDTLKRTLGDVNVSFNALKGAVEGAAQNVQITFEEAAKLSTDFVKKANLDGKSALSLEGELRTGVGMSRSLGLDPSTGMGFLGAMRGMGQTQDETGNRKMALLIGETIAKSNAFAKSDEVMEAISGYVTTQSRASFGANAGGFASMYSSLAGSGLAGMDPANAANILGRINASLSAGGAHGEASQFFTGSVGRSIGLDALQTQLFREAGAFATPDSVFGKGSMYERSTGQTKSFTDGDRTFLDSTRDMINRQYGGNSEQAMLLRAQATGNHMGISMSQALAIDPLKGNQIGELESSLQRAGLSLKDINMGGLTSMSKIVSGSSGDRMGVAGELWGRSGKDALTEEERERLNKAMTTGTDDQQKEILLQLVSARDQENTQGKDIRDSKTQLENIKSLMANQLLPVTQSMRDGVMWMAGKGSMTPQQIRENLAKLEIEDRYSGRIRKLSDEAKAAVNTGSEFYKDENGVPYTGRAYADRSMEGRKVYNENTAELKELYKQRDDEVAARHKELRDANAKGLEPPAVSTATGMIPDGWRAFDQTGVGSNNSRKAGSAPVGGKPSGNVASFVQQYGPLAERISEELGVPPEAILGQWGLETGWGKSVIPGTHNLGNIKDFSGKGPTARDNMTGSVDSYRAYGSADQFGDDFTKLLNNKRYAGVKGSENSTDYFTRLKDGGYAEDPDYIRKGVAASGMAKRAMGTPLPQGGGGAVATQQQVAFEPINVNVSHTNDRGEQVRPSESMTTKVANNWQVAR